MPSPPGGTTMSTKCGKSRSTALAFCLPLWRDMFSIHSENEGRAMKHLIAMSLLIASGQVTAAQYIMQPSLDGTSSYGPESKPESGRPIDQKAKRTAHRRAIRNEQDQSNRQLAAGIEQERSHAICAVTKAVASSKETAPRLSPQSNRHLSFGT